MSGNICPKDCVPCCDDMCRGSGVCALNGMELVRENTMDNNDSNGCAYFVDRKWTWRERLRSKLYPSRSCPLPDAPASYAECVVTKVVCSLSFIDRARVLLSGRFIVETKIVCENLVGETNAVSVCYPSLR